VDSARCGQGSHGGPGEQLLGEQLLGEQGEQLQGEQRDIRVSKVIKRWAG
jgi:hypothetical protein